MSSFSIINKDSDVIVQNKYGTFSKKELEGQLKEGRLTIEELGSIYDLPKFRIVHILRSLEINYRNTIQQTRMDNIEISPSTYQVILGTLMGDSYIKSESFLEVSHSVHQMDYLYTIAEKLGELSTAIYYKKNSENKSISLRTINHDIIKNCYKLFYSKGSSKKFFTKEAIKDLESEGLAYWYMDDGKYDDYGAYLCIGNVTNEEGLLFIDYLKNKFNIETTFQAQNIKNNYHNLYIKANSRNTFFELIKPYIIPSMMYKVIGYPYPKLESLESMAIRHVEACNKIQKYIKFTGDTRLKEKIDSVLKLDNKKLSYIKKIKEMVQSNQLISRVSFRTLPPDEDLISLFNSGMTDQQVADKYGFGRNRIAEIRKRLGISKKRNRNNKNFFPCLNVKLVPINKVTSNSYNPNKVATPEMDLLIHSIEEDGVTQPIVTYYDSERDMYIVIDGFHRYLVLRDYFKCTEVPVVTLNKNIQDRMASTIRHNRARGKHTVELMGFLVNELSNKGWTDEQIAKHLGMEGEELLRLRQQVGCAAILANQEYSNAWSIICPGK